MNQDQYTAGRIFQQTGCLSQDALLRYVDNELSRSEQREVECHLVDCPLCDDALQGIQEVGTAQFRASMERVAARLEQADEAASEGGQVIEFRPAVQPAAARKRPSLLTYLGIAATITLLTVLGILFLGGNNPSGIADSYFKDFSAEVERSDSPDQQSAFEQALDLFGKQQYAEAAPLFDAVGTPGAVARAGNCYYRAGNFTLAAERFASVKSQDTSIYADAAAFDLALTYLKMEKIEEARTELKDIAAKPKHSFNAQALQVLAEIGDR